MLVLSLLRTWAARRRLRLSAGALRNWPRHAPRARPGVEILEERIALSRSGGSVVDPGTGMWYLSDSNAAGAPTVTPFAYGMPGWRSLTGDFDGDGTRTPATFDPSTATWYLRNENSGGAPDAGQFAFGWGGWIPVLGDWDGDGKDSVGMFDPATATWYLKNSNAAGAPDVVVTYGAPGWLPVVGDWNGDGKDSIGVFNPATATFYLRNEVSGGAPDAGTFAFGAPGWIPLAGNWGGGSASGVGAFNPATATFYLRNELTGGAPDAGAFTYGAPGWTPLVAALSPNVTVIDNGGGGGGGGGGGDVGGGGSLVSGPSSRYGLPQPLNTPAPGQGSLGQLPPVDQFAGFVGSQQLLNLQSEYDQAQMQGTVSQFLASQSPYYFLDSAGRVLVNVRSRANNAPTLTALTGFTSTSTGDFSSALEALGMTVTGTTPAQHLTTGWLPLDQLSALPTLPDYSAVTPVYVPVYSAGSVMTQGDSVIGADAFRAQTGKTGSGVTVGVVSDSINQVNNGLAKAVSSADLPPDVKVYADASAPYGSDEGRGMLEVIHDVAPGAGLAFNTGAYGPQAMAQGIHTLAQDAQAKVIVDDVRYPDEPFFNDGVLAQTVNDVAISNDVTYVTAAGNEGNRSWENSWNPVATSIGGQMGLYASIAPGGAGSPLQHFSLKPGQTINLSLQWDSAFLEGGSILPQYQVPNEVDVLVTDASGQRILGTFADNTMNTGEAMQRVVFTNTGQLGTNDFALAFRLAAGPAPTQLKWVRFDDNAPAQYEGGSTIFGHAAAQNALTVGAVDVNNPHNARDYTSEGLTTILFDASGQRLAHPQTRYKPDVVGPDGVSTATYASPGSDLFFGTSAAAAHLAGSAALHRSQAPQDGYWSTVLALTQKAIDIGAPGWDPVTGFGLDPISASPPAIPLSFGSWTLIGPASLGNGQVAGNGNVSGRVTGIATDPKNANILYIATAGGGVWKTTDGGASWTPQTDSQAVLFMGAIAVAPSNGNILYAGTGEANNSIDSFYGRGILHSTDGGASWTLENNSGLFDRQTVSAIAVSASNPNKVYVAIQGSGVNGTGGNTGIYKSTDGGATWTDTTSSISGVTGTEPWSALVIDPNNDDHVYAAIGDTSGNSLNGIYETKNGGGSWAASGNSPTGTSLGRIALAICNGNPKTLVAAIEDPSTNGLLDIYRTTDGGTTWSKVTNPGDYMAGQGWYDNVVAIDPSNDKVIYVGGSADSSSLDSILESTDGGSTWNGISTGTDGNGVHADHHAMAFDASGKLIEGNDGGVWRLRNSKPGSILWDDLNSNLATLQFIGVALVPGDPNTTYGGTQDNGTNKFTGSTVWQQVQGGDGGFVRVDFSNPNTVYHTFFRVSGSTSFIERSDDAGATWTDISAGINTSDNSEFYPPYQMDPVNPSRLVLGTDHVYETTDKGATWKVIATPNSGGFNTNGNVSAIGLAADGKTVYVGLDNGDIFVTQNDGGSWTQINIPNITDRISDLVVDPSNALTVYASRSQFGQGHVFKSVNGGATWTDISANLPDLPSWTLALDPISQSLWVGTDTGVFDLPNGSAPWVQYGGGLPNVQVTDLEFDSSLGILEAGTHGRSVWEISTIPGGNGGGGGVGGVSGPGDRFEPNQTSDAATQFGLLPLGVTTVTDVNIVNTSAGLPDYDWYRWTLSSTGLVSVEETVTQGDVDLQLWTLRGQTLVQLGQDESALSSTGTRTLTANLSAGDPLLIEVHGRNIAHGVLTTGSYGLRITLQ